MRRALTLFAITFVCLFSSADICEDINDLANAWNEVANFLHESGDDESYTESELAMFQRYVEELAEGTYALADALIDLGNDYETKLGTTLRKNMAQLASGRTETIVRDMDNLVDSLDRVTDYCDQQ